MGIFKTELRLNPATLADNGWPWRCLDDLEIATGAWISWFSKERLRSDDRTQNESRTTTVTSLSPMWHEKPGSESLGARGGQLGGNVSFRSR